MRQAVLVEPKHIEFREVEAPKASDLKEHQVLLNIKRIGICGSYRRTHCSFLAQICYIHTGGST